MKQLTTLLGGAVAIAAVALLTPLSAPQAHSAMPAVQAPLAAANLAGVPATGSVPARGAFLCHPTLRHPCRYRRRGRR